MFSSFDLSYTEDTKSNVTILDLKDVYEKGQMRRNANSEQRLLDAEVHLMATSQKPIQVWSLLMCFYLKWRQIWRNVKFFLGIHFGSGFASFQPRMNGEVVGCKGTRFWFVLARVCFRESTMYVASVYWCRFVSFLLGCARIRGKMSRGRQNSSGHERTSVFGLSVQ